MSDNSSTMTLQSLSEIFKEKIFRIPDYQRGYAWETPQLEDFYSDLERLQEINCKNQGQPKMHYCGLLTVGKVDNFKGEANENLIFFNEKKEKKFEYFHIIDGQQRLTTSIILIQAIVEALPQNYTNRDEITEQYLCDDTVLLFGYERNDPSFEFFKTKILNVSSTGDEGEESLYTKRLSKAKIYFKEKLLKKTVEELEKILEILTKKFQFNFYQIDNNLDIHVTFETMNNRGKKLTTLELLKNRLFYLVSLLNLSNLDSLNENIKINKVWKGIYRYLGKNQYTLLNDDDFLNDHWIMYYRYKKARGHQFSTDLLTKRFTPKNIQNGNLEIREIDKYISSLQETIEMWYYIHNPQDLKLEKVAEKDLKEIKIELNRLNRLGLRSFRPLIMSLLICLKNNKIKAEDVIGLLKKIEKFIFLVFSISRNRSKVFDTSFYGFATDLKDYLEKSDNQNPIDKEKLTSIIKEINDLLDFKDKDKEKKQYINVKNFKDYMEIKDYNFYAWESIRYFLYEYEIYLSQDEKKKFIAQKPFNDEDYKNSLSDNKTIEHIYPQTDSEAWQDNFEHYQKLDTDTDDIKKQKEKNQKRLKNSLGNLVLLSQGQNSSFSNTDNFGAKLKCFEIGTWTQREIFETYNNKDWTPKEILKRGKELLEFLEKRWGITISDKEELLGLEFLP